MRLTTEIVSSSLTKKCFLEIDHMKGTVLPPSVKIDGTEYSLYNIFEDAGIEFVPIDPLGFGAGPEVTSGQDLDPTTPMVDYSDEELEYLMKYNTSRGKPSSSSEINLYAYLLIVDGISTRSDTILGIMFDSNKREGTAVFYGNPTIRDNPHFFLRTSTHEMGHQFNLHHEDGTSKIVDNRRKFSIMNQTRTIQNSPDVSRVDAKDHIGYYFGELEKKHLNDHPPEFVAPGGSSFIVPPGGKSVYNCVAEHIEWHQLSALSQRLGYPIDPNIVSVDASTDEAQRPRLEFTIQAGKSEYLPGQPTIIYMELKNLSTDSITVSDQLEPEFEVVKFYIKIDDAAEAEFKALATYDYLLRNVELKPGESIKKYAKIFYGASGYSFPKAATYKVKAVYNGIAGKPNELIQSNTIEVIVRSPKLEEEKDEVDLMYGDEQARFLLYEGGDHLTDAITKLTELAKKYPDSVLGGYANAALGVHWNKNFKDLPNKKIRKANTEVAESFLKVATKNTTGHWANTSHLNLAQIYENRNDTNAMNKVLNDFIVKFEGDSKNENAIKKAKAMSENK